jgi:hypothetical protein
MEFEGPLFRLAFDCLVFYGLRNSGKSLVQNPWFNRAIFPLPLEIRIPLRIRFRLVTILVRVQLKRGGYPGNPWGSHHGDVIP